MFGNNFFNIGKVLMNFVSIDCSLFSMLFVIIVLIKILELNILLLWVIRMILFFKDEKCNEVF